MAVHASMLLYARSRLPVALRLMRFMARQNAVQSVVFVINGDQITAEDVKMLFDLDGIAMTVVHHDNSGAEFGGYQRAVDIMIEQGADKMFVMNDTIGPHQFVDAPFLRDFVANFDADKTGIAAGGRMVMASDEISIGRYSSRFWLQSHILAFDKGALARVDYRVYFPEISELIRNTSSVEEFFSPEIGLFLRSHLTHWLFGSGPGTWYNARPLSADTSNILASKARAILQELSLSMRLNDAGVVMLNHDVFARRDIATRCRCWIWNKTKYIMV